MKTRAILFSGPMVRARQDGRKTQTRRVVKGTALDWLEQGFTPAFVADYQNRLCPYGQPGDRLRVKEAAWMWCERRPNGKTKTGRDKWIYVPMREAPIHYTADHPRRPAVDVVSPDTGNQWGWRLKIGRFLPSWASRITLEVTGVRVERLHDISEADAREEGVAYDPGEGGFFHVAGLAGCVSDSAVGSFRLLWESINGTASSDANPWVWVVEFKRVEGGAA